MDKVAEFDLLPDDTTDLTNTCPIVIKNGKFKDIIYRYGKINFTEADDGALNVTMEIEMINAPEGFNQQDPEFTQTVGNIFTKIIEDQVVTLDEKDLESDVHEERMDNA
jgi:hypothetical protein